MKRKSAIIAYDISSDKHRRKIFRCLQAWGLDGQYSLFECFLTPKEADELLLQLTDFIDTATDSLLIAWVDNSREPQALTSNTVIGFQIPALYIN